jgi:hypothetical protein
MCRSVTATESQVAHLATPITAAVIVSQQVGSNASRDPQFLSHFAITTLPYFVAAAALLSVPAAQWSGRMQVWFAPRRIVPFEAAAGDGEEVQ